MIAISCKMAKKKTGLANKKLQKKSQNPQKSVSNNPFEIHLNKRKYDIIGRKNKHERGLPGLSRSRATKKVHLLCLWSKECVVLFRFFPLNSE